jgi:hypothetical protein
VGTPEGLNFWRRVNILVRCDASFDASVCVHSENSAMLWLSTRHCAFCDTLLSNLEKNKKGKPHCEFVFCQKTVKTHYLVYAV